MPEFEEPKPTASSTENYVPSKDADSKPRTRRRSGGFKTDAAARSAAKIGEVSAVDAIKEEKLSGPVKAASEVAPVDEPRAERFGREPRAPRDSKPAREKREPQAREERAPRPEREARAPKPRAERSEPTPRNDANPQPSEATLAAIARVEARLDERRAERDARRAERDKNRPARTERTERTERKPSPRNTSKKPQGKKAQGGLIAAISGFIGKLFGKKAPQGKKRSAGPRDEKSRGGRPQGNRSGNSSNNNRRGGQGRRPGGNRSGGRGRGQGGGQRRHTATSRSNES